MKPPASTGGHPHGRKDGRAHGPGQGRHHGPHRDAAESWSRDAIEAHQLDALREQLRRIGNDSVYYRKLFNDCEFDARDLKSLEDLARLPFTRKADYVATITPGNPFGEFMCAPQSEVRRMHFSSGTTAAPSPQFWSARDLDRWSDLYARNAYAQGVREGDIFQCMFTYTWFVGGLGATAGYQKAGALVIPAGSQDTERQITTMMNYGTTAFCATPSFALHLAEEVSKRGMDPASSPVRTIMVGGEPGASVHATRTRIEQAWGARCFDAYGCLEFQPIAAECEAQCGLHLAEDFAYAEVVDAETGKAVANGQPGVLVLTHLDKEAGPLVRWWTGDVVVRDQAPCVCGRTHARLLGGVIGRADDMLVVRGVNVFPSAIEELVRTQADLTDEYRIVLDDTVRDAAGFLKAIRLQVEASNAEHVGALLAQRVRERLGVHAIVDVLQPGTLERSTHKARRIIRQ